MKLQTSIRPRRDGTVTVHGVDGETYKFTPDASGDLVCDVTDEATVSRLLSLGGSLSGAFWVADADDGGGSDSSGGVVDAKPARGRGRAKSAT